jgi:glutaredoxin 3
MSVVKIYTTKFCGYCIMAKRLLKSRGIAYEEINMSEKDIEEQNRLRTWLIEASGQRTVPQIFIHNTSIGGFTELSTLDRQKKLRPLLEQPNNTET